MYLVVAGASRRGEREPRERESERERDVVGRDEENGNSEMESSVHLVI